jgi:hypothetical protein
MGVKELLVHLAYFCGMERKPHRKPMPLLQPWGSPIVPEEPDAVCSHCSIPFVGHLGMVSDDFSLCPVCDNRD